MARRGKRVFLVLAALLLVLLVPPLINANRYRTRITAAIGDAIGRRVATDKVTLRLLPEPGFVLENVVVADDPAFSAEPMLRAESLTAALRLSSLWRGRLEVARMSLDYPSLNLVRNAEGRWNVEDLFERGAQAPAAPTAYRREHRPRFPYVEVDEGRINFKFGLEKQVFALTEADLSLWLASENRWETRFRAKLYRTDVEIADSGYLRLEGSFRKAASARETPLDLRLEIEDAQLGQLTRILYGRDRGLRGELNATAELRGTPAELRMSSEAAIDGFRRYDLGGADPLRLSTACNGLFRSSGERFSLEELACSSPAGASAQILLTGGGSRGRDGRREYDLTLKFENLPANQALRFAKQVKRNVAADLEATSTLQGEVRLHTELEGESLRPRWTGSALVTRGFLRSAALPTDIAMEPMRLTLQNQLAPPASAAGRRSRRAPQQYSSAPEILLEPVRVDVSPSTTCTVRGHFDTDGFTLQAQGSGSLRSVLELAHAVGIPALKNDSDGQLTYDALIGGRWAGYEAPIVVGTATLRDAEWKVTGVAAPVAIANAEIQLLEKQVQIRRLLAGPRGSRTLLQGEITVDRDCRNAALCTARFSLQSNEVHLAEIHALLNPQANRSRWRIFAKDEPRFTWPTNLRAEGLLVTTRLTAGVLTAQRVTSELAVTARSIEARNIAAQVFGGSYRGEWSADFRGSEAVFSSRGNVKNAAMSMVAGRPELATGTAAFEYQLMFPGTAASVVVPGAEGWLRFVWTGGSLPRMSLSPSGAPLEFRRFQASLELRDGRFRVQAGSMESVSGIYTVSGTATLQRVLDLRFVRESGGAFRVSGTLEQPIVAPAPGTSQAAQTR